MITVTPDVNLGNLLVTATVGLVGWGVRRLYVLISDAIDRQEIVISDIDDHAEVINLHTNIFVEAGMVKGPIGIPRVVERRTKARIHQV